jgi:hypothetical protein
MGQYDKILKEYDTVMLPGLTSENAFGLVDASSLLWRLEVSPQVPSCRKLKVELHACIH